MPKEDVPFMATDELLAEETAEDASQEERALHLEDVPGEFEDHERFDEGLEDEEYRSDTDSELEEMELDEQFLCEGCHETLDIEQLTDHENWLCRACDPRHAHRPVHG